MTDFTRDSRDILRYRRSERVDRRRRAMIRRASLGQPTGAAATGELSASLDPHISTTPVWMSHHVQTAVVLDFLGAAAAATTAYLLRFGAEPDRNLLLAVAAPFLWVVMLWSTGAYSRKHVGVGTEEYRAIGRAFFLTLAAIAIISYVSNAQLARGFVLPLICAAPVWSVGAHRALRVRLHRARVAGRSLRPTVVVGRSDTLVPMIESMTSSPVSGFEIVGACVTSPDGTVPAGTIAGVPVIGGASEALLAVDRLEADVVAVSSHPELIGHSLRRLGWALAERNVELVVSPGIVEVAGPRLSMRPVAGLSMLHVERPVDGGVRQFLKHAMDAVVAAGLLVVTMPVWLAVAVAIKVTSRGPVFFRQERVGANGRTFRMFKFRSMVRDAEDRLDDMSRDGQVNEILFKHRDDPRITAPGRLMRRYSIDELPQLLNVVRGEMSLVGPRPPLQSEVARYEQDAIQRLRVRPGMTGLWQINGRSDLDWEESLRLDLWYVDNWSPLLDLQILVGTVRAVLSRRGAY